MVIHPVQFGDPWDFEQVYETLIAFARNYPFDTDAEDYLVHITTGTHVAQICLFLLTESRHLPGRLLQSSPDRQRGGPGEIKIIDLDLSKYDRIPICRLPRTNTGVQGRYLRLARILDKVWSSRCKSLLNR